MDMGLLFEWDPSKAERNKRIHGVSFDEACTTFGDPLSKTIGDPFHSEDEQRFVLIGQSVGRRVLVVVHSERDERIRVISARLASKKERRSYEKDEG